MDVLRFPLRRLLSRAEAEHILTLNAALLPGQWTAVFDLDGNLVAQHPPGTLQQEATARLWMSLQSSLTGAQAFEPVCLDEANFCPLLVEGQNMGWLVVQNQTQDVGILTPAVLGLQSMLALIVKERVEKRQLSREVLDRYREVNLLYHLTKLFEASLDVGESLQIALAEAQRLIHADCGLVWLSESAPQPGPPAVFFGALEDTQELARFLRHRVQQRPDISTPNIVADLKDMSSLNSVLYAPLIVHGAFLGLVALGRGSRQREFTAGEENLLLALTDQAASALEKAQLYQQELQRQRIMQELAIGQRIQRSFLPKSMPVVPGWEFAASYQAANQVGGDFYDFFPLPVETDCQDVPRYGITIADVSGKGIPAALMMAFSQGILHTSAFASPNPAEVLRQTNRSILQSSHSGLLLTALYGVLDPCSGRLVYANAGHEPPILYRAATDECLELPCGQSLLLGARRECTFNEFEIQMELGDLLLLYTDGVTEARQSTDEFFAEGRLYEAVAAAARAGCTELLADLNAALTRFMAGSAPQDDITMFAFRRVL